MTRLLDAVEQAVIATDREGRIRYWNRFAEKLYGWTAQEVTGKSIVQVLVPEPARASAQTLFEDPSRMAGGDWLLRRRDGTTVLVHAAPTIIFDAQDHEIGIVGISWDISEKRLLEQELHRTERRLRLIADQLPGMVWATDSDLKVVWNQGAAFRTGEAEPGPFLGKTVHENVRLRGGQPAVVDAHLRALGGETVMYEGASGGRVTQAVVQPFRDQAGNIAGTVGVSLDITERKRVEQELAEKREQLQALTRRLLEGQEAERRALARELHDDLGQFLTAIRLNLESARHRADADCAHRLAESITLVDQAIDRVRKIALDLRPSILDDLGLIAALRSLLKGQSERAGFEGRLTLGPIGPRLPSSVETCSFRIVQEAITNVARHARARRVDVDLRLLDGELRVLVADDGIGFDVADALRGTARGRSLGLLSMQERVTLANGQFEIQSIRDRGTTVSARIPVPEAPAS